jgi:NAD(P)-dependent dehydrogenase (short-subunit alcohol dehydrogenase family)
MTGPLKDQTVLVIGRGGGVANAITLAARDAGALVIADTIRPLALYESGFAPRWHVPHGIDRDLTTHEVGPGRQP